MFFIWKITVATGPVTREASVGAIQIFGFFTMLPIWSMEVPSPWASKPPCQTVERQHNTDSGAADRQRQGDPDEAGYQDSHEEGLHLRGCFYQISEGGHKGSHTRPYKLSDQDAGDDGDAGGDDDVDPGFLRYDFSEFRCHDGGHQCTDRSAQLVAGDPDGSGGE